MNARTEAGGPRGAEALVKAMAFVPNLTRRVPTFSGEELGSLVTQEEPND